MFDQGEVWPGGEDPLIKDMSPRYRRNAAAYLLRHAARLVELQAFSEVRFMHRAPEEVVNSWLQECERREKHPKRWMRETKLYRSLLDGIPPESPSGLFD
jgi:hypothetical protein